MEKRSSILIVIASLMFVFTFLFPLWNIGLKAPQYPEGLGLKIWSHKITGLNEHDLKIINELNHYIGMQRITPESIKELKIMPYILGFLILFGLIAAFYKNTTLVKVWIALIIVLGIIGLYDFYMWEYNYGHNLSPDAPIKIPGMVYQPPLLGTKQLLNITATSLPGLGSIAIFVSLAIAVFVVWKEKKLKRGSNVK